MGCGRGRTFSKKQKIESVAERGGIIYKHKMTEILCWKSIFKRK